MIERSRHGSKGEVAATPPQEVVRGSYKLLMAQAWMKGFQYACDLAAEDPDTIFGSDSVDRMAKDVHEIVDEVKAAQE